MAFGKLEVLQFIDVEATELAFGPISSPKSTVVAVCASCGKCRHVTYMSVRKAVKRYGDSMCRLCRRSTDEFKRASSARSKKMWESTSYRDKVVHSSKNVWDDERRRTQSLRSKALWESLEYKETQHDGVMKSYEDPVRRQKFRASMRSDSHRQRLREASIASWRNVDRVDRHRSDMIDRWVGSYGVMMREMLSDPLRRDEVRDRTNALWMSPSYRKRHAEGLARKLNDPEHKEKLSQLAKRRIESDERYKRQLMDALKASQSVKKSGLEMVTESILKSNEIEFRWQEEVGPYLFDFYLPSNDLFIEVQGEYWQTLPQSVKRDAAKFSYLEKARPESKILYLQEREFLNPNMVDAKIRSAVGMMDQCDASLADFDFGDVRIDSINFDTALKFLNSFHYAQCGRRAKACFGAYVGSELVAVCKFVSVIRQEVATSMGMSHRHVLELDRFCIHPRRHKKNFASWFLSRCSKSAMASFDDVKAIVSFADLTYGHFGTIYKAANWSISHVVRPDYHYVSPTGWVMHKKSLYSHAVKMGMKEREYAEKFGYVKVFGKCKTKYVLFRSGTHES